MWQKNPRCGTGVIGVAVSGVKGSLTRDFQLQNFFINQCPPGLWVSQWDRFEFFRKFAELIANEYLSAVSTTPAKKDKNFEIKFFKIFHLFFIFRCRQANIGRTLYLSVVLTPVNRFLAVSLTSAINFRPFGFLTGINDTGDKLFTGVNDTADKLFSGVNVTSDKLTTEVCAFCKTISGRRSRPRPPILSLEQP